MTNDCNYKVCTIMTDIDKVAITITLFIIWTKILLKLVLVLLLLQLLLLLLYYQNMLPKHNHIKKGYSPIGEEG